MRTGSGLELDTETGRRGEKDAIPYCFHMPAYPTLWSAGCRTHNRQLPLGTGPDDPAEEGSRSRSGKGRSCSGEGRNGSGVSRASVHPGLSHNGASGDHNHDRKQAGNNNYFEYSHGANHDHDHKCAYDDEFAWRSGWTHTRGGSHNRAGSRWSTGRRGPAGRRGCSGQSRRRTWGEPWRDGPCRAHGIAGRGGPQWGRDAHAC